MMGKNLPFFTNPEKMGSRSFIYEKVFGVFKRRKNVIDRFHKLYYTSEDETWKNTFWLGTPTQKCPLDLWIYQEIIFNIKPDAIIECGTYGGGSALFLASICDLLSHGEIITIDIKSMEGRPKHKRITYLLGSTTSQEILEKVQAFVKNKNRVMVILDSDHNKEHVLKELEIYSQFVSKNSYLIVEDTNINGHPVEPDFGPGPMEAVEEFLEGNKDFVIDTSKEKFYMTFSPNGFLKRAS